MEKKSDVLKNLLINLGILLILVGSTSIKTDHLSFFFLGLVLLALQTFDFKGTEPKKLAMAEIIISAALAIVAVTQLIMATSFRTPQVFIIILLLGTILIVVEAVRKYADLL